MSGVINSFDEVVTNSVKNRPRSNLTWYGKVEISANNEVNVHVLLCYPSQARPPGELFQFKRDSNSNDLVFHSNSGSSRVEEKEDHLLVHYGSFSNPYTRFSKLDERLGETLLVPKYRKKLIEGVIAQEPEAIRWATDHGLPVWLEKANFSGLHWEKAIMPYVPFEYEKGDK
jgi:hypothetical protein